MQLSSSDDVFGVLPNLPMERVASNIGQYVECSVSDIEAGIEQHVGSLALDDVSHHP